MPWLFLTLVASTTPHANAAGSVLAWLKEAASAGRSGDPTELVEEHRLRPWQYRQPPAAPPSLEARGGDTTAPSQTTAGGNAAPVLPATDAGEAPWVGDSYRLAARLGELRAFAAAAAAVPSGNSSAAAAPRLPWPLGTVDFDRIIGVDRTMFAERPEARCARLVRPPATSVTSRSPIAVLLTGQLRTAEVALPFIEENLVRASAPRPVHAFAHVWAPEASHPPPKRVEGGPKRHKADDMTLWPDGSVKELTDPAAGRRAMRRLKVWTIDAKAALRAR